MFSGKTTELLRRLDARGTARVLAFKHVVDDRYDPDAIVTHGGRALPGIAVAGADAIRREIGAGVALVAVDEGHFFDASLIDVSRELVERGVDVIVTSLDLDSWGRPFAVAERLAAMADETVVMQATCGRCGAGADHTQRLTPIVDGNMVGGPESYEPRCRKCWRPPPEPPQ
jgi:thymidine kinase